MHFSFRKFLPIYIFLSFLLCGSMVVSAISLNPTLPTNTSDTFFTDTAHHWAKEYIEYLKDNCAITGYKDANGIPLYLFKPDQSLSRAEMATFAVQCKESSTTTLPLSTPPFEDTSKQWFSDAVAKAHTQGWISGYSSTRFAPYQQITRAEALKIILKMNALEATTAGSSGFHDVPSTHWAYMTITFAAEKGIIAKGPSFRPDAPITRGEVAKIIANTAQLAIQGALSSSTIVIPTTAQSCSIFPADNPWNTSIKDAPLHPKSDQYIASILSRGRTKLHPDFGSNPDYGIPFNMVAADTTKVPVNIVDYPQESDRGPFPIPPTPHIEAGGDKHLLLVDMSACMLYELYNVTKNSLGWEASSAATFDMKSNALRPKYWTSADAAGLPIFPGLVRYEEVKSGKITHALRFTVSKTQKAFISPARHYASSSTDEKLPPMGLRLRLKASYDISTYTGDTKVILEALQTYGMIIADNGSDWFISGATDARWNDEDIEQLKNVPGNAFEAVYTGEIEK